MVLEEVEVERGLLCEGLVDVGIEVDGLQTAAVVGAEGYLAAGVGRDSAVAIVGIAVGHALADDGVPEEHTGLGAAPRVGDNLVPQRAGVYLLGIGGVGRVDGVLLDEGFALHGTAHELVGDLHRHVGARDLALLQFGIDKVLGVRVLDADGEHQGSTAPTLRHLARGVAIAHHERHDAGGGQGAVLHRTAARTDVAQVVAHTTAALHQLHLLLVNLHNAAIGVAIALVANHKAVAQRDHLEVVADAAHGAALRHDVAEVLEQVVDLLLAERVGILLLDAGIFGGQAAVHHVGVELVDAVVLAESILVHPHVGGQLVAMEILDRGAHNLLRSVLFQLTGLLLGFACRK